MDDLTKKENQTFKNWFKIMWSNSYILVFVVALAATFIMLNTTFDEAWHQIFILIPFSVVCVVVYKGFIQYWRDLKQGQSR